MFLLFLSIINSTLFFIVINISLVFISLAGIFINLRRFFRALSMNESCHIPNTYREVVEWGVLRRPS